VSAVGEPRRRPDPPPAEMPYDPLPAEAAAGPGGH